ncbi:hypothetical protein RI129_010273 [Pyrocoelia pectoralis]|uniref:Beta-1,4-N-acetylgalactosaminyltransferase n=1 Tax=Pyrocoelia pectoralis TaxID=417401 RepID=A0AAN7VA70_9COLE
MLSTGCQSSTLYKGLLTLIIILIALEYLFGGLIEHQTENLITINGTRHMGSQRLIAHHPIVKAFKAEASNVTLNNSIINGTDVGESIKTISVSNITSTTYYEESSDTSPSGIQVCPEVPANLTGKLKIIKSPVPTVLELEKRFTWLKPGGHFFPETCRALHKVAIIIPFRSRGEHLLLFLQHMHPLLRRQQIDYTIFVVEQEGNGPFNRAMLMNIGYKEALNFNNFHCFIFHDIDLLPEDDRNLYNCPEQPRHMSVAIDIFKYRLPYKGIFGGVSAISKEHFELLNGFSNSFWGWGGEDDDMSNRIRYHKLHISRYPLTIAKYTMLTHKKDRPSPHRYEVLRSGQKRFTKDGINSLKYTLVEVKQNLLYTWLLVKLEPPS